MTLTLVSCGGSSKGKGSALFDDLMSVLSMRSGHGTSFVSPTSSGSVLLTGTSSVLSSDIVLSDGSRSSVLGKESRMWDGKASDEGVLAKKTGEASAKALEAAERLLAHYSASGWETSGEGASFAAKGTLSDGRTVSYAQDGTAWDWTETDKDGRTVGTGSASVRTEDWDEPTWVGEAAGWHWADGTEYDYGDLPWAEMTASDNLLGKGGGYVVYAYAPDDEECESVKQRMLRFADVGNVKAWLLPKSAKPDLFSAKSAEESRTSSVGAEKESDIRLIDGPTALFVSEAGAVSGCAIGKDEINAMSAFDA